MKGKKCQLTHHHWSPDVHHAIRDHTFGPCCPQDPKDHDSQSNYDLNHLQEDIKSQRKHSEPLAHSAFVRTSDAKEIMKETL